MEFPPVRIRILREALPEGVPTRIREPQDLLQLFPSMALEEVEVFQVVLLDNQAQVRAVQEVTRGTLNSTLIHPREVFRAAIREGAAGLIVVHNHPSGDPTPSAEDRAVTRQLVAAGQLLDIPVYDHVIIAGQRWTSFSQAGLL